MPADDQTVSNKDLWIELRKIQDQVTLMVPQGIVLQDHETRLRAIERWRYALPTSLVLAVGSIAVTLVELKG